MCNALHCTPPPRPVNLCRLFVCLSMASVFACVCVCVQHMWEVVHFVCVKCYLYCLLPISTANDANPKHPSLSKQMRTIITKKRKSSWTRTKYMMNKFTIFIMGWLGLGRLFSGFSGATIYISYRQRMCSHLAIQAHIKKNYGETRTHCNLLCKYERVFIMLGAKMG